MSQNQLIAVLGGGIWCIRYLGFCDLGLGACIAGSSMSHHRRISCILRAFLASPNLHRGLRRLGILAQYWNRAWLPVSVLRIRGEISHTWNIGSYSPIPFCDRILHKTILLEQGLVTP